MKNRHGKYWFSQLHYQVWHESMLERWALMFLDFSADIAAISAQPCLMQFEDGAYHYPDYFVVYNDGKRGIVDVHFEAFNSPRSVRRFQNTKSACERIGWSYGMFRSVNPVVLRNLELLSMYRHSRYAPTEDVRLGLIDAVDGLPFAEAVGVDRSVPFALTTCRIYHLVWSGDLTADLTRPFNDHTILWSS
ncbi:TnsA-like heteromeric transposase endonuclease subunit [Diaminobutyricibacter tongyongensis]|uniref:TnsA-like heteromeric transposase endonuclease subunit n=1 Tax=Leifsonia tongyongensis TaxID=1268043 RepID=A0A6L9Y2W1_9MICO|nr:TnsA-like heteromeric transposase endonuclease subunit [Diaminobutyricibacter tongyongensis]NEN07757.1 TnsA-like heteromeric transposase endonuclease subunit [Diaminobutyricibacter tongyongensis]